MKSPLQTPTGRTLRRAIEKHVKQYSTLLVVYANWYCGITNNPEQRRRAHGGEETYFWLCLNARSLGIASAIETWFHKKGMLETDKKGGAKADSKYVYVYKKHPTVLD